MRLLWLSVFPAGRAPACPRVTWHCEGHNISRECESHRALALLGTWAPKPGAMAATVGVGLILFNIWVALCP